MLHSDLPAKEAVQLCLNFNVRKVARLITQYYNTALQPSGLLSTQFSVLVALSFEEVMTISDLSEVLVTDRTTLARNLIPLQRQNYLSIDRGELDRRKKYVRITYQGEQALEKALPLWAQAQEKVKSELGYDVWSKIQSNLNQLVSVIQG